MPKVLACMTLALVLATVSLAQAPQAPLPDANDPNYRAKGDQTRTYRFPGTEEDIPYHLYVPTTWDQSRQYPLVVVTHGAGQAPDIPFQRGACALGRMAEERGFIIAAVTGYHSNATALTGTNGGWNNPYEMVTVASLRAAAAPAAGAAGAQRGNPGGGAAGGARGNAGAGGGGGAGGAQARGGAPAAADPCMGNAPKGGAPVATVGLNRGTGAASAEDQQRAELDIVYVRGLVAREYNVDMNRIYLMGNSTGGGATWSVAQKYPELWTAIAPSAGPLYDESYPYERLRTVAVLAVHGDVDTTMDFAHSREMIDHAKARGVDATFLPVAGGSHIDAWAQPAVIQQTFDFFDAHQTKAR